MKSSVIRTSVAVAVAVIVLLAFPSVPLGAQTGISTRLAGVPAGATVTGSVGLRAEASAATGVRRIELSIGDVRVARRSFDNIRNEVSMSYRWDSEYRPASSSLGPNREYVLRVSAVANSGATNSTSMRVRVDNPPNAPTGLAARNDSGGIVVEWHPNPEPDIVGYRVERDSGGGFRSAGEVSAERFSERPDPGTYSYRVIALRSSSTSSDPLGSSPSAPASATVAAKASRRGGGGGGAAGSARGSSGKTRAGRRAGGAGGLRSAAALPRFGSIGLPSGVALPGRRGLENAPSPPGGRSEWGSYSDTLPYDLGGAHGTDVVELGPGNIAARSPERVIPPDGLRWVAAGLLLVAASGLLRILAMRLERALPGGSNEAQTQ